LSVQTLPNIFCRKLVFCLIHVHFRHTYHTFSSYLNLRGGIFSLRDIFSNDRYTLESFQCVNFRSFVHKFERTIMFASGILWDPSTVKILKQEQIKFLKMLSTPLKICQTLYLPHFAISRNCVGPEATYKEITFFNYGYINVFVCTCHVLPGQRTPLQVYFNPY
jgi:hypothetical protein